MYVLFYSLIAALVWGVIAFAFGVTPFVFGLLPFAIGCIVGLFSRSHWETSGWSALAGLICYGIVQRSQGGYGKWGPITVDDPMFYQPFLLMFGPYVGGLAVAYGLQYLHAVGEAELDAEAKAKADSIDDPAQD